MDKEEREFKGLWIPKEIWFDTNLTWSEKLLFVEIDSFNKKGSCFAGNQYFADFFNLSKDRISKLVSSLKNKGYIDISFVYKPNSKQIEKRIININPEYRLKQLEGVVEGAFGYSYEQLKRIVENYKDINTSNINTNNNTSIILNETKVSEQKNNLDSIINPLNSEKEIKETKAQKTIREKREFIEALIKNGASEEYAKEYVNYRASKKISISKIVLDSFLKESQGLDLNHVIETCILKNWQGFKKEWYQKENPSNKNFYTTSGKNNVYKNDPSKYGDLMEEFKRNAEQFNKSQK